MSTFWRPFDTPSDTEEDLKPQHSSEKNERMKIRVTENEKTLILEAYNGKMSQGWDAVVRHVRHNVQKFTLNSRVVDYYLNGEKEKVKRRMKRIVNEALKEASSQVKMPGSENYAKKATLAEETVQRQMRYAHTRTPLQRKEDKMSHFKDPNDESTSDDDEIQPPRPKKQSFREIAADAQKAHKEMCQQAMASMGVMNNIMAKLDRKLDDL